MRVKFWGTRGSIPVPGKDTVIYGGNTTCLEINLESGKKVIIDAGTGIRALGEHLASEGKRVNIHLLITHIHWDHVMGIPFFPPIYEPENEIYIDGYHSCMKGLSIAFDNKMGDGFFPIRFEELHADIRHIDRLRHGSLKIDNTIIDTIPLQHPQGGLGFRFREGGKTLVFITDNELTGKEWSGRHPINYVKFCEDADVLIHDAQYTPEEMDRRRGWGHSDYASAFKLAQKANVKKLILFHHDPYRKDKELALLLGKCQRLAGENNSDMVIEAAMEESELSII